MIPSLWFSLASVVAPVVPLSAHTAAPLGDAELVTKALEGDRFAQHALYERHAERVMLRVTRLLGRVAEAEDVAQDAFFLALRDLKQLRDKNQFGAWVQKIAVHQVHRRFRRRRLRRALGLERGTDDATLAQIADPSADPALKVRLSQLDAVLAKVPVRWRSAWILRHVEGCPLAEVAEQCGCSLATVKRYISRAEERVQQDLSWEWAGGELRNWRQVDAG